MSKKGVEPLLPPQIPRIKEELHLQPDARLSGAVLPICAEIRRRLLEGVMPSQEAIDELKERAGEEKSLRRLELEHILEAWGTAPPKTDMNVPAVRQRVYRGLSGRRLDPDSAYKALTIVDVVRQLGLDPTEVLDPIPVDAQRYRWAIRYGLEIADDHDVISYGSGNIRLLAKDSYKKIAPHLKDPSIEKIARIVENDDGSVNMSAVVELYRKTLNAHGLINKSGTCIVRAHQPCANATGLTPNSLSRLICKTPRGLRHNAAGKIVRWCLDPDLADLDAETRKVLPPQLPLIRSILHLPDITYLQGVYQPLCQEIQRRLREGVAPHEDVVNQLIEELGGEDSQPAKDIREVLERHQETPEELTSMTTLQNIQQSLDMGITVRSQDALLRALVIMDVVRQLRIDPTEVLERVPVEAKQLKKAIHYGLGETLKGFGTPGLACVNVALLTADEYRQIAPHLYAPQVEEIADVVEGANGVDHTSLVAAFFTHTLVARGYCSSKGAMPMHPDKYKQLRDEFGPAARTMKQFHRGWMLKSSGPNVGKMMKWCLAG